MADAQEATKPRGKLYELIVVEPNLQKAATNLLTEQVQTFKNKEHLFNGKVRTLEMFGKNGTNDIELTAIEQKDKQVQILHAKVPETLNYVGVALADYWDCLLQKELTNQTAVADVVLADGTVLLTNMPAVFLLAMESRLEQLRPLLMDSPTLPPNLEWIDGTDVGAYIYKTKEPAYSMKTEKKEDWVTHRQSSDKHPDSFEKVTKDTNVGKYTETRTTGTINSADKAAVIERFDDVVLAIKQARQRANAVEVVSGKAGDVLLGHILGSWYDRTKRNTEAKV